MAGRPIDGREVAALALLYAPQRRQPEVPCAALLGLDFLDGGVEVTIEAEGGKSELLRVTVADDARLDALRPIDRRRVALALEAGL
jgi:hypothetical protein